MTSATAEVAAAAAAILRSMPFTRLVDCGMNPADARELRSAVEGGRAWDDVAEAIGERRLERAGRAAEAGNAQTRRESLRAAAAAYNFAQMALTTDVPRKRTLYSRFSATISTLAAESERQMRRIELPVAGGALVGWLCLPAESDVLPPTVIQWGGLSGWGASYLKSADALNRRGIACLLAEGPGQGTPRLEHALHLDSDFVTGFDTFVSAAAEHPDLSGVVGVQGNSFGGLIAAHVAASDERVAACVVNGAPSHPALPDFRTPREQMLAALGRAADVAEDFLPSLAFEPSTYRIRCPLLVLQGGADPLATPSEQAAFLAAGDPCTTTERIWPDGEHTLYNHADDRDAEVADWFARVLVEGGHPGRDDAVGIEVDR